MTDNVLICQCRLNWWIDVLLAKSKMVGLEREHAMVKCLLVVLLSAAKYNGNQLQKNEWGVFRTSNATNVATPCALSTG